MISSFLPLLCLKNCKEPPLCTRYMPLGSMPCFCMVPNMKSFLQSHQFQKLDLWLKWWLCGCNAPSQKLAFPEKSCFLCLLWFFLLIRIQNIYSYHVYRSSWSLNIWSGLSFLFQLEVSASAFYCSVLGMYPFFLWNYSFLFLYFPLYITFTSLFSSQFLFAAPFLPQIHTSFPFRNINQTWHVNLQDQVLSPHIQAG